MARALLRLTAALALAAAAIGCGRPFDVKTAPGFVELEGQGEQQYQYRATTPEGVVVAIRVVEDESRGDIDFWTHALLLQLREVSGYALVANRDVTSLDGTKGKLLQFGHDEDNKPYEYWVAVFAAQDRLFLVEAGAPKAQFDRARPNVEWMFKSVRVKCSSFVAPVLASRTCNRW